MANPIRGPLALPETSEPLATSLQQPPIPSQMQARQAGALPPQQAGALPVGGQQLAAPQQPPFQGFGAPGGMNQLNQIYGLLAQYGDDPSQIGQSYVNAIQQQQRLSRENQPLERWMQLYGNINPHDFDTESLAKFHDNLVKTGQIDYRLLDRHEPLTDTETKMLAEADRGAQELSRNMLEAHQLAQEYEGMALQGVSGGLVADVKRWLNEKMGREGHDDLVYRRFDELKNSSVIANLPPGIASDTDIALAMKGWPPATASPAHVAAFLRGRQKMMAIQHAEKAHESYFLSKERTRAGLASHWSQNRDSYVTNALERFGGVRRPQNPDGSYMTPEQAADHYIATKQMTAPMNAIPTPGRPPVTEQPPAPVTGQPPRDRKKELMNKYRLP